MVLRSRRRQERTELGSRSEEQQGIGAQVAGGLEAAPSRPGQSRQAQDSSAFTSSMPGLRQGARKPPRCQLWKPPN